MRHSACVQVVSVTFEELSLEASEGCSHYESVLLGDSNGSLLGRFCGTDVPPTITTSGPRLTVHFVVDRYNYAGRFALSWKFVSSGGQGL